MLGTGPICCVHKGFFQIPLLGGGKTRGVDAYCSAPGTWYTLVSLYARVIFLRIPVK